MPRSPIGIVRAILVAALLGLILNAFVSYSNIQILIQNNRLVSHTQRVLAALERELSLLEGAESAQRGYLLVGEAQYLTPYLTARDQLGPQLTMLQQLTVDNPNQQQRITTLTQSVTAQMTLLQQAVDVQKAQGTDAARAIVTAGQGAAAMDASRATIAAMEQEERTLLTTRVAQSNASTTRTVISLIGATVLAALLTGTVFWLYERENIRRRRREAEREMLLDELTAALNVRDQFLTIASHELKTPLTALMGFASLLERRLTVGEMVKDRDARAVTVIGKQATRLSQLMSTLLDITRIQNNQLITRRALVDVGEMITQIIDELDPLHDIHHINYDHPARPIYVLGDEQRLEQILLNLIQNAIKYSPEGGTITIHLQTNDEHVTLSVADQGIGIPAESLPHLFTRFFRASNTAAYNIDGFGIGLYVVKELVMLQNGTIGVDSIEGEGSTFTLTFPVPHDITVGETLGLPRATFTSTFRDRTG